MAISASELRGFAGDLWLFLAAATPELTGLESVTRRREDVLVVNAVKIVIRNQGIVEIRNLLRLLHALGFLFRHAIRRDGVSCWSSSFLLVSVERMMSSCK